MARAGTARTDRAGVARFDFRVGALSQAGLLLQEHSLGVIQSVGVSAERNTVMLKSGTPQQTVAVETISSDMIFTANINEKSKRNIGLFLNTGIADYDETRTEVFPVNTGSTGSSIVASDTTVVLNSESFTEKTQKSLLQLNGATAADAVWGDIDGITGLEVVDALKTFNLVDNATFGSATMSQSDSKVQNSSYVPYHTGAIAAKDVLVAGVACTDAIEGMPNGVINAAYTAFIDMPVTSETNSANFLVGFKAVRDAVVAVSTTTVDAYTAASTATTTVGAAGLAKAKAFMVTLNTLDAGTTTLAQVKAVLEAAYNIVVAIDAGVNPGSKTGTFTSTKADYVAGYVGIKSVVNALAVSATTLQTEKVEVTAILTKILGNMWSYHNAGVYFLSYSAGYKYVQTKVSAYRTNYPVAVLADYAPVTTLAVQDKQTAYDAAGLDPGSYVIYDKDDPMTLAVVEVASFTLATFTATLAEGSTVGTDFSSTATLEMYKANVIAPLRDFSMPYYSVRLVELDAKSRAPEVTDIWKCAITSGSNMTLNSTDFSAWDIVMTSVYPTISDMTGDLAHVKDKINAYGACARYMLNDI
jgi:hypothetical protein